MFIKVCGHRNMISICRTDRFDNSLLDFLDPYLVFIAARSLQMLKNLVLSAILD